MNIHRRIDRLEAATPDHPFSARVMFKNDGEPAPDLDPPLKPNEMAILVNFVAPASAGASGSRHKR